MSGFGPQYAPITTAQLPPGNFDQLLGRAKKAVDVQSRETYMLCTMGSESNIFSMASVPVSQANTTVQAFFVLPGRVKIPKIAVFCSALGANAINAASFNIVLGTAAYSQGSIPGNDNSSVPNVAYNAAGEASGSGIVYPAGGAGICTNPAVAGNAMFASDVVLSTTNFPNLTTATGTGTTFAQVLVPSSPDAVWPNAGVLTLRFTTAATLSTVTNFVISCYLEPQPLSASFPASNFPPYATPEPNVDF